MGDAHSEVYRKLKLKSCSAVVHVAVLDDIAAALSEGTLHDFARRRPDAVAFRGRGEAFAFSAPLSGARLLVRRSRHGGLLGPITGEAFTGHGRAPHELKTSILLRERGVPTPEVLAYAAYPLPLLFSAVDVVLRFIPDAVDLVSYLNTHEDPAERVDALRATAALMRTMAAGSALHPDLNLRNILVVTGAHGVAAWLLDVDRVLIGTLGSSEVAEANLARFLRSAEKLNRLGELRLHPGDLRHVQE